MNPLNDQAILQVARRILNITELRPGQTEAIEALLKGSDVLAVMPTGWGKSAIYQLAAQFLDGPVVVVSPLIALELDQMAMIEGEHAGRAVTIHSLQSAGERRTALDNLEEDGLVFVFLAPEQLTNPETLERLKRHRPALFVVDEAHCISDWGHDFRPDYLALGIVVTDLGHPPVLALTATASPPVREEIVARLSLREPTIIVRGFDRPNIWLGVELFNDERTKREAVLQFIDTAARPGIVYVATRQHTDEIADAMRKRGLPAAAYHAGMSRDRRDSAQQQFMDGSAEIIVATIAFGMGIDHQNVRFVAHYDIPASVDAYYQEIGRAGRDGKRSEARLFYSPNDLSLQRFLSGGPHIDLKAIESLTRDLVRAKQPTDLKALPTRTRLSAPKLRGAVARLEAIGAIEWPTSGTLAMRHDAPSIEAILAELETQAERRRRLELSRVEMMRRFAELQGCRRKFILNYFGEDFEAPCNACDNCQAGKVARGSDGAAPFPLASEVEHPAFGRGLVQHYEDGAITILFNDAGYKVFDLKSVLDRQLLRSVPNSGM
ncbi:MAG: putative ATP-dependent helicase recQ [Chloroflexi bacterium]|nr:putative ATP-dependent helicase recQ [Chloroflexota bacterium]